MKENRIKIERGEGRKKLINRNEGREKIRKKERSDGMKGGREKEIEKRK